MLCGKRVSLVDDSIHLVYFKISCHIKPKKYPLTPATGCHPELRRFSREKLVWGLIIFLPSLWATFNLSLLGY